MFAFVQYAAGSGPTSLGFLTKLFRNYVTAAFVRNVCLIT